VSVSKVCTLHFLMSLTGIVLREINVNDNAPLKEIIHDLPDASVLVYDIESVAEMMFNHRLK
jgi:hypothetical protein